jgi:hypothetical protein
MELIQYSSNGEKGTMKGATELLEASGDLLCLLESLGLLLFFSNLAFQQSLSLSVNCVPTIGVPRP